MLKDIYGQRNLIETLDIWDMQLAEYGKKILERRKQFIKQVNDIIADIHYKLTGGKERITLTYESSLGNITFETALSKYRERDLRMKSTTVVRTETISVLRQMRDWIFGNSVRRDSKEQRLYR